MSKPVPPGPSPDDTDWEAEEASYTWHQWHYALEWAHKGDFEPLAECLRRSDLPLNNEDVRNWLADGLSGGFKKPRKITKRPKHVPFEMAGRHFYIDERHLKQFEAMRRASEIQATGVRAEEAIDRAASEHNVEPETLKNWMRREREYWGLSPARYDRMFANLTI